MYSLFSILRIPILSLFTFFVYAGSVAAQDSSDCSESLQRAIDSCALFSGSISLRPGIYRFSRTIYLHDGVALIGSGMGTHANQKPVNGTILEYTGQEAALEITGTNCSLRDLALYNPGGQSSQGIILLADSQLLESVVLSRVLMYGFTGGNALLLEARHHGGIDYCSFYDCRIRHAKIGIQVLESDRSSFVNSNSFFHGAISGGGFDDCILVNGGDNNVFYSTVIEPYTSTHGHLVVNRGQIIGENIRIEAARQPTNIPVILFGPASALSQLTGAYGGGLVVNQGNNSIQFATSNYAGENNPGYNQFVNAAFLLPASNGIPAFWTLSSPRVQVSATGERVISGENVLSIRIPPGIVCDFYPAPGYGPTLASNPAYGYANFNVLARTNRAGVLKLTYNYAGGMVSSVAQSGSGEWETVGLRVLTHPGISPNPKINLNNSGGTDTLLVEITSPSFSFGTSLPQREASVLSSAGGIMTGTLTTGLSHQYSFTKETHQLVLPLNGNVFDLSGERMTIDGINRQSAVFFPPGTIITLLFDHPGNTILSNGSIHLKSAFTSTAPNTSLTLLSYGEGSWRELNRNN